MGFIFFVLAIVFLVSWTKEKKKRKAAETTNSDLTSQLQSTTEYKDQLQVDFAKAQDRIAANSSHFFLASGSLRISSSIASVSLYSAAASIVQFALRPAFSTNARISAN